MPHIIVGSGAEDVLDGLGSQLRSRTVELAGTLDGTHYRAYSPWMAGRPLQSGPLPATLLERPERHVGEVVTSRPYLAAVAEFLHAHPDMQVELIGNRDDWAVAIDVENTRPLMVGDLIRTRDLVSGTSRFFDVAYRALIQLIVPLQQPRPRGWSLQNARGLIFLGFPDNYNRTDLALDLVHEMGHQALSLFQSVDPIFTSDPRAPIYSEVRKTNRPALQSLHAASAIAFMALYLNEQGLTEHVHPDFDATMPVVLEKALRTLRRECTFTRVGEQILDDFEAAGHATPGVH